VNRTVYFVHTFGRLNYLFIKWFTGESLAINKGIQLAFYRNHILDNFMQFYSVIISPETLTINDRKIGKITRKVQGQGQIAPK